MIDRDLTKSELEMIEDLIDGAGLASFLEGVSSVLRRNTSTPAPITLRKTHEGRGPRQ